MTELEKEITFSKCLCFLPFHSALVSKALAKLKKKIHFSTIKQEYSNIVQRKTSSLTLKTCMCLADDSKQHTYTFVFILIASQ